MKSGLVILNPLLVLLIVKSAIGLLLVLAVSPAVAVFKLEHELLSLNHKATVLLALV
jgi:hypothetical protein